MGPPRLLHVIPSPRTVEGDSVTIDPETLISHAAFVRGVAAGLLRDKTQVDDVVQQTLLKAIERPPRQAAALRGWLWTVAVNLCRKLHRTESRGTSLPAPDPGASATEPVPGGEVESTAGPDGILARKELVRALVDAVASLAEPYRSTLLLHFYEELSYVEIADRQGVPVKTVRTRVYRALDLLRGRLDRRYRGSRGAWWPVLASLDVPVASSAGAEKRGAGLRVGSGAMIAVGSGIVVVLALWVSFSGQGDDRPSRPGRADVAVEGAEPDPEELRVEPPIEARSDERSAAPAQPPDPDGVSPSEEAAPPAGSLRVRVTWSDGTPAEGVKGRVLSRDSVRGRRLSFAGQTLDRETGSDGMFLVEDLAPGKAILLLDRMQVPGMFLIEAERESDAVVRLLPGVDVEVFVVDDSDRPVPGAEIVLDSGLRETDSGVTVGRAGPDGRFRIRALSRQRYVGAKAPPLAASLFSHVDGSSRSGTVELTCVLPGAGGEILGQVLGPELRPVTGAAVLLEDLRPNKSWGARDGSVVGLPPPFRTRTEEDGTFRFRGIRTAPMTLLVSAPGHAPYRGRLDVEPGSDLRPEIVLPEGVTVKGIVTDGTGRPVAGARVTGSDPAVGMHRDPTRGISDEEGRFVLEHLVPGRIEVAVDGGNRGRFGREFETTPGEELVIDARLSPGHQIRGRLRDEKGQSLAGWRVVVKAPRAGRSDEPPHKTLSDVDLVTVWDHTASDGGFGVANLRPTEHRLEVFGPEQWCSVPCLTLEDVLPDAPELDLTVLDRDRPSAFLRGRLVFSDGSAFGGATIECRTPGLLHALMADRSAVPDGRFALGPLRAGRYRITVSPNAADPDHTFFPEYRLGNRYSSKTTRPAAWTSPVGSHALGEFVLEPGQDLDLGEVVLGSPGTLSARIQGVGDVALSGTLVTLLDRWKNHVYRCPFDGERVTLDGLFPGEYVLLALGLGPGKAGSSLRPFEIRPGEKTSLDLTMQQGELCRVVCVEPEGERWSTLLALEVRDEDGTVVWSFTSSRHRGEFVYGFNLSLGRYTVTATTDGGLGFEQTIRVRPGQSRRPPIRLRLVPGFPQENE